LFTIWILGLLAVTLLWNAVSPYISSSYIKTLMRPYLSL
jgi:hypothetical protein